MCLLTPYTAASVPQLSRAIVTGAIGHATFKVSILLKNKNKNMANSSNIWKTLEKT